MLDKGNFLGVIFLKLSKVQGELTVPAICNITVKFFFCEASLLPVGAAAPFLLWSISLPGCDALAGG